MNIADKKKQNNIAEYIIYMYQTEDLIRAFDCDMEQIRAYVLKHIPQAAEDKEALLNWYQNVLEKMTSQGVIKTGHISDTQAIVTDLEALKDELINQDEEFAAIYDKAKSHIQEMKAMAGIAMSDVQICLNGVYGLLLAKINGRQVPDEIQPALDQFGNVLSYLSYKYKQQQFLNNN